MDLGIRLYEVNARVTVMNERGERQGVVRAITTVGPNTYYRVQYYEGDTVLIPADRRYAEPETGWFK